MATWRRQYARFASSSEAVARLAGKRVALLLCGRRRVYARWTGQAPGVPPWRRQRTGGVLYHGWQVSVSSAWQYVALSLWGRSCATVHWTGQAPRVSPWGRQREGVRFWSGWLVERTAGEA